MRLRRNLLSAGGAAMMLCAATAPVAAQEALVGDAARGERLYGMKCGGCHSLDMNRVGPLHRGVVGRKSGSVDKFPYSLALKNSGLVWTEESLDVWLQNPMAMVKGTRMGFRVADAQERADIIAYLKSASPPPAP